MNSVLTKSLESYKLPDFLRELTSLIIVLVNREGEVLTANQGFLRIAPIGPKPLLPDRPWNVRQLFVNPRFEDLLLPGPCKDEKLLFQGIMNIGSVDKTCYSLQGRVCCWKEQLLPLRTKAVIELS